MKIKVAFDLNLYGSTEMEPAFLDKIRYLMGDPVRLPLTNKRLEGSAICEVQQILTDALHEFSAVTRRDPQTYVEKRYAWMSKSERDRKVGQVKARCNIAQILLHSMTVPEVEGEEGFEQREIDGK